MLLSAGCAVFACGNCLWHEVKYVSGIATQGRGGNANANVLSGPLSTAIYPIVSIVAAILALWGNVLRDPGIIRFIPHP